MLVDQLEADSTRTISAQPDSARQYANPIKMIKNLWAHRELIGQFTESEILQSYQGSYLGLAWSFITPLARLIVYTFVFSGIFKARWEGAVSDSHTAFALVLFAGLIAFSVFNESIMAAPNLIVANANYVKKVVFPLEILPVSILGSTLIHSLFSLLILLASSLVILGRLPWTIVFLPLMYLPLILLTLGLSWFLASLGVFIRDLGHVLGVVMHLLFFLTPIMYPASLVPERLRFILFLNPLTFIVNHFRRVALGGQTPDWGEFLILTIMTLVICMLGYIWFMKSKKTFADVV